MGALGQKFICWGAILLSCSFTSVWASEIYTVELETKKESLVNELGESVEVHSKINVAEMTEMKGSRQELINWARQQLDNQWERNPKAPVEVLIVPNNYTENWTQEFGESVQDRTGIRKKWDRVKATIQRQSRTLGDDMRDQLIWKSTYRLDPNTKADSLPENIQPAYKWAQKMSTGKEQIIIGEPNMYNPQVENFGLAMVRTFVNGSLIASSLFVITTAAGQSMADAASTVLPLSALAALYCGGLQYHAHRVRVFLKKKRFGFSSADSSVAAFMGKQFIITATFVTLLRGSMAYTGMIDGGEVFEFAQRVGVTSLQSLLVGMSFGLILRDRTVVKDEVLFSSRDKRNIQLNNRLTILVSFLATLGETLMQSESPMLSKIGSIELAVAAGGAYLYWLKTTSQRQIVDLREGFLAAKLGHRSEAKMHFYDAVRGMIRPTRRVCTALFAN